MPDHFVCQRAKTNFWVFCSSKHIQDTQHTQLIQNIPDEVADGLTVKETVRQAKAVQSMLAYKSGLMGSNSIMQLNI